jgi:hypothetical protein
MHISPKKTLLNEILSKFLFEKKIFPKKIHISFIVKSNLLNLIKYTEKY